jgi:hypothetical protein
MRFSYWCDEDLVLMCYDAMLNGIYILMFWSRLLPSVFTVCSIRKELILPGLLEP